MDIQSVIFAVPEYKYLPPAQGADAAGMKMARLGCWARERGAVSRTRMDGELTSVGVLTEPKMLKMLDEAMEEDASVLLVYYAGHGLKLGGDFLLPAWNHDPYTKDEDALGIKLQDLFQRAADRRIRQLVLILDCSGDKEVGRMVLPPDLVDLEFAVLASGRSRREAGFAFADVITKGLDGEARDGLGSVTPASLHSFVQAQQKIAHRSVPVFRGLIKGSIVLAKDTLLSPEDQQRFLSLFQPDGVGFPRVEVTPDHEIFAEGHVSPARSRPKDTSAVVFTQEMKDQDLFKKLRNLGYLETCAREPNGDSEFPRKKDIFWACLEGDAVRLTPLGEEAWQAHFGD